MAAHALLQAIGNAEREAQASLISVELSRARLLAAAERGGAAPLLQTPAGPWETSDASAPAAGKGKEESARNLRVLLVGIFLQGICNLIYLPTISLLITVTMERQEPVVGYAFGLFGVGCLSAYAVMSQLTARFTIFDILQTCQHIRVVSGVLYGLVLFDTPLAVPMLLLSRLLQGVSFLYMPLAQTWIAIKLPPEERAPAIAKIGMMAITALALAPLVGGALVWLGRLLGCPLRVGETALPAALVVAVSLYMHRLTSRFSDRSRLPQRPAGQPSAPFPFGFYFCCLPALSIAYGGMTSFEVAVPLWCFQAYGWGEEVNVFGLTFGVAAPMLFSGMVYQQFWVGRGERWSLPFKWHILLGTLFASRLIVNYADLQSAASWPVWFAGVVIFGFLQINIYVSANTAISLEVPAEHMAFAQGMKEATAFIARALGPMSVSALWAAHETNGLRALGFCEHSHSPGRFDPCSTHTALIFLTGSGAVACLFLLCLPPSVLGRPKA